MATSLPKATSKLKATSKQTAASTTKAASKSKATSRPTAKQHVTSQTVNGKDEAHHHPHFTCHKGKTSAGGPEELVTAVGQGQVARKK
jgi:hypothetical protein